MFWDLSRLGSWQRFWAELRDAEEEAEAAQGKEGRERMRVVEQPGWMPARKAPRRTVTGEAGGGNTAYLSSTAAAANYKTTGGVGSGVRTSGKQLGTRTSTSPDPETLLSAAGAAGGSGRPGSSSRERPGSRGSTTTTATATATATQTAASRPPGIGLGGYTQKQLDEWHDQCDITDSHKEIKPHKTVTVDGKGQHFVGRQVAWSPEGNWCVVVGNSNRAMIFQRWGK